MSDDQITVEDGILTVVKSDDSEPIPDDDEYWQKIEAQLDWANHHYGCGCPLPDHLS